VPSLVKTIITKRQFDFTDLQTSASLDVIVLRAVDVTFGEEVELSVRVHGGTIQSGHSIEVLVKPVSITPEEPEVDYLGATVATANLPTAVEPMLIIEQLSVPFGAAVQVVVRGTKDGAAGALQATISADLVERDY
jgi:hypothetical protein